MEISIIDRDGLVFPMRMIRITAEKPYFGIVYTHAPIYDLYTTSAVPDRQFHLPGDYFFLPGDNFFFAGESDRPVTLFELVRVRCSTHAPSCGFWAFCIICFKKSAAENSKF